MAHNTNLGRGILLADGYPGEAGGRVVTVVSEDDGEYLCITADSRVRVILSDHEIAPSLRMFVMGTHSGVWEKRV